MTKAYRIIEGRMMADFHASRMKVQIIAGGYANGKTSGACIKAMQLAKDYPGSNGLIARATFPKLNDTIRKEFFKWFPPRWKKNFDKKENTLELTNGSTVNFRYIAQQGKTQETTTSNLLSATYDWIVVDQLDDPEITHKDFLDLLGRLRGDASYVGDDATMPRTGPRWFIGTCNPTRNWVYRELARPYHQFKKTGEAANELIPYLTVFEGSTYENKENLSPDYIQTLEVAYSGQMRDRYLLGKWEGYEGLVYPTFDFNKHLLSPETVRDYYERTQRLAKLSILESYDYGMAVPACYLLGFVDTDHNVIVVDGFYQSELSPERVAQNVKETRMKWRIDSPPPIFCDPAIFRRTAGTARTVGDTVARMLAGEGLTLTRGNSDIINGIVKVKQYLQVQQYHAHPVTGIPYSPRLYFSNHLQFLVNEITDYYWKKDSSGEPLDIPVDRNDHAMDALKYMLTKRPRLSLVISPDSVNVPAYMRWNEQEVATRINKHRYVA